MIPAAPARDAPNHEHCQTNSGDCYNGKADAGDRLEHFDLISTHKAPL
jgi:hypothetical protein